MKFNLSHFLAKRNLTIETFISSFEITSLEKFRQYLLVNEFVDDKNYTQQVEILFQPEKQDTQEENKLEQPEIIEVVKTLKKKTKTSSE